MPKKLLLISLALFSGGAIFFTIIFMERSVCGQQTDCCACPPTLPNTNSARMYIRPWEGMNTERLLNRQTGEWMSGNGVNTNSGKGGLANFYPQNPFKKKALTLPKTDPQTAALLRIKLRERAAGNGNNMEFAEYFTLSLGGDNYYFREDNESIKFLRVRKDDSKLGAICGRYALIRSGRVNDDLTEIEASGEMRIGDLWRKYGNTWKPVLEVMEDSYREIYPLIMTKVEMDCLGDITKPFNTRAPLAVLPSG